MGSATVGLGWLFSATLTTVAASRFTVERAPLPWAGGVELMQPVISTILAPLGTCTCINHAEYQGLPLLGQPPGRLFSLGRVAHTGGAVCCWQVLL